MKKTITLTALLFALASCNFEQKLTKFYQEKCPNTKITKTYQGGYLVSLECSDLYDSPELKKYVKEGKITYDFVNGKLSGRVQSVDSIPDLYKILKLIAKGTKK